MCQKKNDGNYYTPQPPVGGPYLFSRDETDTCTFQKRRWIFNPRNERIDVRIGVNVPDGSLLGRREYRWYTVAAKADSVSTGYDLGRQYVSPNCFDQDFFISTWKNHKAGDPSYDGTAISLREFSKETGDTLSDIAMSPVEEEYVALQMEQFERAVADSSKSRERARVERKPILRQDCSQTCGGDTPNPACFSNRPPDRDRIVRLRDRVLATKPGSTVSTAELSAIFDADPAGCGRSDTAVSSRAQISNDGEICAYPMALRNSENAPSAAIHIGRNVEGFGMSGGRGASIMFNKPHALPHLAFKGQSLQKDYGGNILELSADATGVYMNVGSRCIRLRVD